jgi:hypothetical protein
MPPASIVIRYEFARPDHTSVEYVVELDPKTLLNRAALPAELPDWARLPFEKCANCPLANDVEACPTAGRVAGLVARFGDMFSYERVSVKVTVPERAYAKDDVPVQAALSPLIGLLMVTSGCPILGKLRPQARFHLPFASELETITRATSMYLLAQYLVGQKGGEPDWALAGLAATYRATSKVNRAFANRLRAAAPKDANVNALIRLDTFAQAMPATIEDQMEELQFLFD